MNGIMFNFHNFVTLSLPYSSLSNVLVFISRSSKYPVLLNFDPLRFIKMFRIESRSI